jgi:hypothetical protein
MKDSKGRTLVFILNGVDNPKDDAVALWNEAMAELESRR